MKLKIPKPPQCPFCGKVIEKPTFLTLGSSDYEAGFCSCGAVYVVDATGFSRGAVFLEALTLACGGDLDLALSLLPEEDYQEVWLENYDPVTHTIPGEPLYEGRKIRGALCFIKLAEDLEELKSKERERALPPKVGPKAKEVTEFKGYQKRLSRKEAEELLAKNQFEELIGFGLAYPLNLNVFQKLLYHPEEVYRKKGAYLLGRLVSRLALREPQRVLDLLKRLLYASADSAASPWGALEATGEILRETGDRFSYFVKNLFGFLAFPEYRVSTLYALMRIAEKNPQALKTGPLFRLLTLFPKVNALSQALIIQIFSHLKGPELFSYKKDLLSERVSLFDFETFTSKEASLSELWKAYKNNLNKE